MATRNLLVRAGFDASGMTRGTRQANAALRNFGQTANRSMSGLSNTMSASLGKIGKLLAGVFAVKAIADFGKQCIDLGSDLTEVQNVVDVTFGDMAKSINEFASTAIEQFGLSETAAKKYAGVFGSMSTSMGLSKEAALEMSKSVTGLTGDVASFFNLSNDMAYTKLKSIWTGETETLKDLGVVMTQTNLKQFSLSRGITKSIDKMTEAEKVMLRYEYVTKALSNAQGDFARNSDSWANQTRILSERFNALKATLGQGLINVFSPIVKWLNVIIERLQVAANAFTNFTNSIFGNAGSKQETGAGIAAANENMADLGSSADDATDSIKKAKNAIAGFDEVNTLGPPSSSESDLGAMGINSALGGIDTSKPEEGMNNISKALDVILTKSKELSNLFKKGFDVGIKSSNFSSMLESIQSIGKSLKNIFTDGNVVGTFNNMLDSWALNLGKVAGSMTSIGTTIAVNMVGGIATYLESNNDFIKDRLVGIMNIYSRIGEIAGNFSVAFADIFSVFGGETAQQITADIVEILVNPFLAQKEVLAGMGSDILNLLTKPIIDNAPKIKSAIENLLQPLQALTGAFADVATNGAMKLVDTYYQYVKPAFDNITQAVSNFTGTLVDGFNTYIAPTLQELADVFVKTIGGKVGPLLNKGIELFGKICELVGVLLKGYVEPLASFVVSVFGPALSGTFTTIGQVINTAIIGICDVLDGLITIMTGITDFLVGTFTGDWGRAWEGIKNIFVGVWNGIIGVLKVPLNLAIAPINGIIDALNKVKINVPDWIGNLPGLGDIAGQSWGFNIPKIPQLARGGIINSPTIAQIGEAGPEAVVPLENTGFVDAIGGAVGNAVMNAMQFINSSTSTGASNPVFEVNDTVFARAIMPALLKEFSRMGVDLV